MQNTWRNLVSMLSSVSKVVVSDSRKNIMYTVANAVYFIICAIIVLFLFFILSFYTQINLIKNMAIWLGVLLSFYWVISAMWCLYDKDDYGRGVSASDDFYNTAFTSFWLIEGFLLGLFLAYARMFDFYDPFLESDEVEHALVNEDVDSGGLRLLLLCFVSAIIITLSVDIHNTQESLNFSGLLVFISVFFLFALLAFLKLSVRFIEEFDFEEDGDFLFDESDNIFEHEDFPDEGFDGGDYAEGYEILQLFFGYWHYAFIVIHLTYLIYALLSSGGRQQYVYWATAAISQNTVLIIILDYLDWGEVFTTFDFITYESIYPWFYSAEDVVADFNSTASDIGQLFEKLVNFLNICNCNTNKLLPSDDEFKKAVMEDILKEV